MLLLMKAWKAEAQGLYLWAKRTTSKGEAVANTRGAVGVSCSLNLKLGGCRATTPAPRLARTVAAGSCY